MLHLSRHERTRGIPRRTLVVPSYRPRLVSDPRTPLDWTAWRGAWPHAAHSRFVHAAGIRWHVQLVGEGPPALLLHGTAGASHSWHSLLPRLATRYTVVALDLPGHGFTGTPAGERLTLPGMAADVRTLLDALALSPRLAIGHSAGAAILLRMALDGALPDLGLLVGLNAAIIPPPAIYRRLAGPGIARLFTSTRTARVIANVSARLGLTDALLNSTGSRLPATQQACYQALMASDAHINAALTMMAQWDVPALLADVHRLQVPTLLLAGEDDRWIPPRFARAVAEHMPGTRFVTLPGHGHLMHEEAGEQATEHLLREAELLAERLG